MPDHQNPATPQRRLAAILAADVVGFSKLMGSDEEGTLTQIKALRKNVIEPNVQQRQGRIVKTTGDGFLVEFQSPVEAVRSALAIQEALTSSEATHDLSAAIQLRIGINLGDILIEPDGDIYGDGVNVAARLEQLAEPGGVLVSGGVYEVVRDKVGVEFRDRGEQTVKNIARPVRVYAVGGRTAPRTDAEPLPLPDKPSIAVLPFTNLSDDRETDWFADGVVEDIIAALGRVGAFFVIARESSFTYKGRPYQTGQVGRKLGVRYLLDGSVRRSGARLRITGRLVEAASGRTLWTDRFEGDAADVFQLQDSVTEAVVGTLEPTLREAEVERVLSKPTTDLSAFELFHRGLAAAFEMTVEKMIEAQALLTQAVRADPGFAAAKGHAALWYANMLAQGGKPSDGLGREAAIRFGNEAIMQGRQDAVALRTGAQALWLLTGDHDAARVALDRAVALNPNSPWGLAASGWVRLAQGDRREAIKYFERASRLSPLDRSKGWFTGGIALALLADGDCDAALEYARRAVRETPNSHQGHRILIVVLVLAGRTAEAKAVAATTMRRFPTMRVSAVFPHVVGDHEFAVRYLNALREAGLPE